jgi:biopolymer transport protein ExbD
MISFKRSSYTHDLPAIQLIPMIDVLFVILSFFMAMFLHFNFESSLDISVPTATSAAEANVSPQEIIINISKDGGVYIGQKAMDLSELGALLRRTVQVSPRQAVVVRADQKTYHERVIQVLDVCAKANIWNISFATAKEL